MMVPHSPFTNHQLLQFFLYQPGNPAHVSTALDFGFQYSHDFAHILQGGCSGFPDCFIDQVPDLIFAQLCRQVGLNYGEFPVFLVRQIVTPGVLKLRY